MPSDPANRTLVLSVVAVDLVCYSQKSVAEQISLKDHFNQVLLRAIGDISIADRIILDTGDGVAMGFLGDPEDALYVAMFMHDAINRDVAGSPSGADYGAGSSDTIRIGINLGPVKLATGVGGHPNIVGDGINVAERIMSFAEPGQLTASRPFFEVMSRMSDHYATLFQYTGVRTDKQVRSHDVYLVGKSAAAFQHAAQGVAERAARRAGQPSSSAIPPALSRAPAAASPRPAKSAPPIAAAAKMAVESPPFPSKKPAPSPMPAKAAETPAAEPAIAPGERHSALIDFLDDRNKVATTATLLAVVAVTLGALLAYRKMSIPAPAGSAPAVAALSPAPVKTDARATEIPSSPATSGPGVPAAGKSPAPVGAESIAKAPASAPAKAETKLPPPAAPAVLPLPAHAPSAAKPIALPVAPATSAAPAKSSERPPAPADSKAATAGAMRDKPKDAKIEKAERSDRPDKAGTRDETRGEPRKPPPRTVIEREKTPPATAAPIIPTYQSPAEAPRPAVVAPTQPPPAPAAVADTGVTVISRSAPPYPVEGIRQVIKMGFVKARLSIDAGGNVTEVGILEARPIAAFGRETRNTLKNWKFNPGAPGRSYEIEITFKH